MFSPKISNVFIENVKKGSKKVQSYLKFFLCPHIIIRYTIVPLKWEGGGRETGKLLNFIKTLF